MKYELPQNPPYPGTILQDEFLEPIGMSQAELAKRLCIPLARISGICRGRRAINAETAILFGTLFGTTAKFWLNAQIAYDLANTKVKTNNIKPLKLQRVAYAV